MIVPDLTLADLTGPNAAMILLGICVFVLWRRHGAIQREVTLQYTSVITKVEAQYVQCQQNEVATRNKLYDQSLEMGNLKKELGYLRGRYEHLEQPAQMPPQTGTQTVHLV